jgi:hypothetical protein
MSNPNNYNLMDLLSIALSNPEMINFNKTKDVVKAISI